MRFPVCVETFEKPGPAAHCQVFRVILSRDQTVRSSMKSADIKLQDKCSSLAFNMRLMFMFHEEAIRMDYLNILSSLV